MIRRSCLRIRSTKSMRRDRPSCSDCLAPLLRGEGWGEGLYPQSRCESLDLYPLTGSQGRSDLSPQAVRKRGEVRKITAPRCAWAAGRCNCRPVRRPARGAPRLLRGAMGVMQVAGSCRCAPDLPDVSNVFFWITENACADSHLATVHGVVFDIFGRKGRRGQDEMLQV